MSAAERDIILFQFSNWIVNFVLIFFFWVLYLLLQPVVLQILLQTILMKLLRCFFYCYCWVGCEHSWVLDWEWGHLVLWVLVAVLLFFVWRSWCNFGALDWMSWSARRVEEGAVWVWLFFIMFNQSLFQWLLILKWGILKVCLYAAFILKFSHFLKHFCLSYSSLCYYHFSGIAKNWFSLARCDVTDESCLSRAK